MSHYECSRCGNYLCSPACEKAEREQRQAYWAEKALERQSAINRTREFLDSYNMSLADRVALELVVQMAGRSADEALRFSKAR